MPAKSAVFERIKKNLSQVMAMANGRDGLACAKGKGAFAQGGKGGVGHTGRGGDGGSAVALGENSVAIGGKGGDVS